MNFSVKRGVSAKETPILRPLYQGAGNMEQQTNRNGRIPFRNYLKRKWRLYAMLILPAFVVALFQYVPLAGLSIAFQDFNPDKGFLGSDWVGMKWFRIIFQMPDFPLLLRNTVVIAVGKIVLGQIISIAFALLLNEITRPIYKRMIQTITYFPHFLSWVIIGGIFTDMLSSKGLINQLLGLFNMKPIFFLGSNQWFQSTMILLDLWKEFGSSI